MVVVGVSTSGCIRATAVDAIQHGFVPLVVADAVGDRAPEPHESNLCDLQAKYAEVVDEATALAYLGGRAVNAEVAIVEVSPRDGLQNESGDAVDRRQGRARGAGGAGRCPAG